MAVTAEPFPIDSCDELWLGRLAVSAAPADAESQSELPE
jgi:hypothetical protein